jgi:hypothetical protein
MKSYRLIALLLLLGAVLAIGAAYFGQQHSKGPALENSSYAFLDDAKTRLAFEQRARQGDGLAAYNLANYYALLHEPGTAGSKRLSRMWIEQSARNNYPEGMVQYANLLQLSGRRENCMQAISLLRKVAGDSKSRQARADAENFLKAFHSRPSCEGLLEY